MLLEVLVQEHYFRLSNFFVVADGVVGLDEHKKTNRYNCLFPRNPNLLSSLALSYYNVVDLQIHRMHFGAVHKIWQCLPVEKIYLPVLVNRSTGSCSLF